jgi:hypothetical protein
VPPIALALFGGRLKIFDRHCVVAVEGGCFPSVFMALPSDPSVICFFLFFFLLFTLNIFLLLPLTPLFLFFFYFSRSLSLFLFFLLLFIYLFLQHLLTITSTIITPSNLNPCRVDCVQGNFRSFKTPCFSASVCRTSIRREGGWMTLITLHTIAPSLTLFSTHIQLLYFYIHHTER